MSRAQVAFDVPVAFVFETVVVAAQVSQVRGAGRAAVLPCGGVIEVAVTCRPTTAGEGAVFVAKFGPPFQVGRDPVAGAVDVEQGSRDGMGQDPLERRRVTGQPSRRVGIYRPVALERARELTDTQPCEHRDGDRDRDGDSRGTFHVGAGEQVARDVGPQLGEDAVFVVAAGEGCCPGIESAHGLPPHVGGQVRSQPAHAVTVGFKPDPTLLTSVTVTLRQRLRVELLTDPPDPLPKPRRRKLPGGIPQGIVERDAYRPQRQCRRELGCDGRVAHRHHTVPERGQIDGVRRRNSVARMPWARTVFSGRRKRTARSATAARSANSTRSVLT
jgi:hypothetical protein